jgi:hypothetical protein
MLGWDTTGWNWLAMKAQCPPRTNPDRPTVFRSQQQLVIPAGSQALGFTFPQTYMVDSLTIVQGHLVEQEFTGSSTSGCTTINLFM